MSDTLRQIPSGPESLNNDWLTEALRRSRAVDAAVVSRFSPTPVERQGAAGVVGYELGQCVRDFSLGLTSSLLINVVAAANIDFDLLSQRAAELNVTRGDLVEVLFGRLAAAIEAHDVIRMLAS